MILAEWKEYFKNPREAYVVVPLYKLSYFVPESLPDSDGRTWEEYCCFTLSDDAKGGDQNADVLLEVGCRDFATKCRNDTVKYDEFEMWSDIFGVENMLDFNDGLRWVHQFVSLNQAGV